MCNHKRHGIVTNQNPSQPYDKSRAHASVSSCNREECIEKSVKWVARQTNEAGSYYSDAEREVGVR